MDFIFNGIWIYNHSFMYLSVLSKTLKLAYFQTVFSCVKSSHESLTPLSFSDCMYNNQPGLYFGNLSVMEISQVAFKLVPD